MRKAVLLPAAAVLLAGITLSAYGLDVPLKYKKVMSEKDWYAFSGFGNGRFSPVRPDGRWVLPPFNAGKPLFAVLPLGDKPILMVLDANQEGDATYSRLWVDSDSDGELQDEKPMELGGTGAKRALSLLRGKRTAGFTEIDLKISLDGAPVPYSIVLNLASRVRSPYSQGPSFSYQVSCAYTGSFRAGGKQYTVTLCDRTGNGRFDDRAGIRETPDPSSHAPLYPTGDMMYLTEGRSALPSDGMAFGDLLLLNDTLYRLKVDLARGKVVLDAVKEGLSPLKLPVRPERLSLVSADGGLSLAVFQPARSTLMVPAGKYRLLSYQLLRRDGQGDLWRFQASGTGQSPLVEVVKGTGASPVFGEPFTPIAEKPVNVYIAAENNYLTFTVFGRGGEMMTGITHLEGKATRIPLSGSRKDFPREPTYTIVKPDGEIVAKGAFAYG